MAANRRKQLEEARSNASGERMPDTVCEADVTRRQLLHRVVKGLEQVEYLEKRLNIVERWGVSSIDWQETASLAVAREYQLALDKLERLVVSRIFELTKMNMSGTGKPYFSLQITLTNC